MPFYKNKLNLQKKYSITVKVKIHGHTFSGELNLSPKKIKLEVYGETTPDMDIPFRAKYDEITCTEFNNTYLLRGITTIKGNSMALGDRKNNLWSFKKVFLIEYVIFCPVKLCGEPRFESMNIFSNTLNKWVGRTKIQEKIISQYENNEVPKNNNEFFQKIEGIGLLGISYNLTLFTDSFDAGIKFPPSLFLSLHDSQSAKSIIETYEKLYDLMYLITGGELEINNIGVSIDDGYSSTDGIIYFSIKNTKKRLFNNHIFFPLSKDKDIVSLDLPIFPLETFNAYFNLSEEGLSYIKKYKIYRNMNNIEDKFLGYFRILEALTHTEKEYLDEVLLKEILVRSKPYLIKKFDSPKNVRSFLQRLPRLNKSKYNTERCIQDFFLNISKTTRDKWVISKNEISSICRLRNDITHANSYKITNDDIRTFTKFIEILLVLKLYNSLGIDLSITEKIIDRVEGYNLLLD